MYQPKEELDQWYSKGEDPWDYETTPDDIRRKDYILSALKQFEPFDRALDLGAGEAWITKDLPAKERHGFELSDVAASRFPDTVLRNLAGKYDLVVATGVLYSHYDWPMFLGMIKEHASRIVLTCNIKQWEMNAAILQIPGKQVLEMEFPYRQYIQKLRVFNVSSASNRP